MANNTFTLFAAKRPSIGSLICNCTINERHGGRYLISDSPVEDGTVLTDHVIRAPIILDMVAIFSPYPDNIVDNIRAQVRGDQDAKGLWARIRALADSRETFDVYTVLELYRSMIFESFEHTEQDEGIIRLQATLRQIQVVKTLTDAYVAPSVMDNLSSSSDVGLQPTSPL